MGRLRNSRFIASILLICCCVTIATVQQSCNVSSRCYSWTRNTCLPNPVPPSSSAVPLKPSPVELRESYNVCPVVSSWNVSQETYNVTDALKEARLFIDWLCRMPCEQVSKNLTKQCINRKIEEYRNISGQENMTLLQGNQTVFRSALATELHRLEMIANKPLLNFEEIKRRIDHLASFMGIRLDNSSMQNVSHQNLTDKSKAIMHVNQFINAVNSGGKFSFDSLQWNASDYDIQLTVNLLEQRLMNQGVTATLNWQHSIRITPFRSSTRSVTNILQPSTHTFGSSCFVSGFHCRTTSECPGQTAKTTSTNLLQLSSHRSMARISVRASMATANTTATNIKDATSSSSRYPSSSVTPTPTASVDYCTYDCKGLCNGTAAFDCEGICGGNASRDDCGECTGGSTGKRRNYLHDCASVCRGTSRVDACNVCELPSKDAGNGSRHHDCNMVCFGSAISDVCGRCVGGNTGRKPSVPDACGVICNGDNSTCSGCDNVPNSGKVLDACGVCGGNGDTCTTITKVIPNVLNMAERRVIVQGAGLNGTQVYCVIGSTSYIGISVNITTAECILPSHSQVGKVDLRLKVTKRNTNTTLGPLPVYYYNTNSLSFTTVSPKEMKNSEITSVTVQGSGFQQTNISTCRVKGSSKVLSFTAIYINESAFLCHVPRNLEPGSYALSLHMNGAWSLTQEKSANFTVDIFVDPPRILEAKFSNSGSQLIVTFTSLQPLIQDCSRIFTANVTAKLGTEPLCNWIGNTKLRLTTGRNASILPGMYLALKENVFSSLQHSKNASGSIVLKTSDQPLLPSPVLTGPSQISSCSNLELSAAQSTGSGGRPLRYSWTITSGPNSVKIQGDLDRLPSTAKNIIVSHTDITANEAYVFSVSVTNFLSSGRPVSASHTTRKAASPIPEVSIVPSSNPRTVLVAKNFYLSAKIKSSPCSANFTAGYTWSSTDSALSTSASFISTASKQTLMISAGTLAGGKTYTVKLSAFWQHDQNLKNEVTFSLNTAFRPLAASIKGGDFSVGADSGNFALDANSLSYDPDNIERSFNFAWSCTDKVTNGNCISQMSRQPITMAALGIIYINPKELKQRAYEFTVNVSSSSTRRWKTAKATITIKPGRIPTVTIISESEKVNPDRKFSLRAVVGAQRIASLQWSSVTTKAGSSKIDFSASNIFITPPTNKTDAFSNTSAYFVLKPGILQPGAMYTIRLSVTDSQGSSFSESTFTVYEKPTPGHLDVQPSTVEALNDVTLTASLWTISSDCLPLKYEFCSYGRNLSITCYGIHSEPHLVIPAPIGKGSSNQLVLAVKVHSSCQTFTEKKATITSTAPANLLPGVVNNNMDKAMKAATSGDLASAVASLDSLLGVATSGGNNSMLKDIEARTLSTLDSMSKDLPGTPSVSSSLLGVLKKVEPNKLDTSKQLQSIADTYKRVLDGLKASDIEDNNVQETIDRLADIDSKATDTSNGNVSETILQADESLASSLTSKTGPGQVPFQVSDKNNRMSIKVAYSDLAQKTASKSGANPVDITFGQELASKYKNWKCSDTRSCEGVFVKIRNYRSSPASLNDNRIASTGTKIIDIALSNPLSGTDLTIASLTTPITFNMTIGTLQSGLVPKCVYFDKARKIWNDQGMRTVRISANIVKCEASHLTSFAVIQDVPLSSSTVSQQPGATVSPTNAAQLDTFQLSFVLANQTWNSSLSNSSSSQALALKSDVKNWIDAIFSSDPNYNGISGITFSMINDVKVKVSFDLTFKSGTTTEADIAAKIKSRNGSGNFHIDTASLSVKKTINATPSTTKKPTASEDNKAVLLAIIFGILGAIIFLLIVYLVVRNVYKRSKAKVEPTDPPGP